MLSLWEFLQKTVDIKQAAFYHLYMKYDFAKLAKGLKPEDVDPEFARLYRDVRTQMTLSRRDILQFLSGRQSLFLMTSSILRGVKDLSPVERKELQNSIHTIIGHAREGYQKELFRVRSGKNSQIYLSGQFSSTYVDGLLKRANDTMKQAATLVVNAIMAMKDKEIYPRLENELPEWQSLYYEPRMTAGIASAFQDHFEAVADYLYIDSDEVYDFLYDTIDDDNNTISMDMFEMIAKNLEVEDVIESNQFYGLFDGYINEVKDHFRRVVMKDHEHGLLNWTEDDPRWTTYASQINEAMEVIAYDLVRLGLDVRNVEIMAGGPTRDPA